MSSQNNPSQADMEAHLDEAEILIWALLDERLDAAESSRLSKLIEDDAAVRSRYIDCIQLHVDLTEHFGRKAADANQGTAILPNLLPGLPSPSGMPHHAE